MKRTRNWMLREDVKIPLSFHDTDAMRVVWHGNYARFFEKAREALLDSLGYGYVQMDEDGVCFPVTDLRITFRRPLTVGDRFCTASALLIAHDFKITFDYEVRNSQGQICAWGSTDQVCMETGGKHLTYDIPKRLVDSIEKAKPKLGPEAWSAREGRQ